MPVRRVSPEEAKELMEKDGYTYVDVRSEAEFEAGHPTNSRNVPLLHMGRLGMTPNHEFLEVMAHVFPKDAKLVIGCKSGGRSLRAATMLQAAGFANVVEQRAGYDGAPDMWGRLEPGWRTKGLPTSSEAPPEHTYEGILAALR